MNQDQEISTFLDLIFHNWTALQYVTNNEMTLELKESTMEFVSTEFDAFELAQNYNEFMNYYLNSSFEDGSCLQVAQDIYEFVTELKKGNSLLKEYESRFPSRGTTSAETCTERESIEDALMDSIPRDNHKKKQDPIIDEDGFTLVQRRKR